MHSRTLLFGTMILFGLSTALPASSQNREDGVKLHKRAQPPPATNQDRGEIMAIALSLVAQIPEQAATALNPAVPIPAVIVLNPAALVLVEVTIDSTRSARCWWEQPASSAWPPQCQSSTAVGTSPGAPSFLQLPAQRPVLSAPLLSRQTRWHQSLQSAALCHRRILPLCVHPLYLAAAAGRLWLFAAATSGIRHGLLRWICSRL